LLLKEARILLYRKGLKKNQIPLDIRKDSNKVLYFFTLGVDIVTVQQLLGHSTVAVTMRYTHTNLESKHAAVARLESFGDSLVTVCTKMQQTKERLSLNGAVSYNVSAG